MEQKEANIPIEGTDRPTKLVYKVSATPRGLGKFLIFKKGEGGGGGGRGLVGDA